MPDAFRIESDDLSDPATRGLIARHLRGMHENTPAESVHALDLTGLQHPSVSVFSAWSGDDIAAVGAYKRLDDTRGEIKSMRVADDFVGRGLGRLMLRHIEREARADGIESLWLETGSGPDFVAARGLYISAGYVECAAFGTYEPDPLSTFMTRALD